MAEDPEQATRWLTPEERLAWIAFNGVLIKLPFALDAELRRTGHIAHFDYLVLSVISETPRRTIPMSELAVLTNASLSRLSHVVTRLEERGWVVRTDCPTDRRATNAVLTDEGMAVVAAAAPGHVATVRDLVVDALTPAQIRQLTSICQAILARVDPDGDWPPRRVRLARGPAELIESE
jgi:DNA-binding MarR family transcriptional regulator